MVLSLEMSTNIIHAARRYIGKSYNFKTFDCIHFILNVYRGVGIQVDRFGGQGYPPENLHLNDIDFDKMPLGHSVFFKRKASMKDRLWTHAAIIISPHELIHCSRHFGNQVIITPKIDFMETYTLAPKQ